MIILYANMKVLCQIAPWNKEWKLQMCREVKSWPGPLVKDMFLNPCVLVNIVFIHDMGKCFLPGLVGSRDLPYKVRRAGPFWRTEVKGNFVRRRSALAPVISRGISSSRRNSTKKAAIIIPKTTFLLHPTSTACSPALCAVSSVALTLAAQPWMLRRSSVAFPYHLQ